MTGRVDFNKSMDFWQQDKWNGYFPVKWHIIKDIPNPQLRHIILENNDHKPVTNSRDTQEVRIRVKSNYLPKISKLFLLYAYCGIFPFFRYLFRKVLKYSTFSKATHQEHRYWTILTFTKAVRKWCRKRKQDNLCNIPTIHRFDFTAVPYSSSNVLTFYLWYITHWFLRILFSTLLMNVCMWLWDQFGITLLNAPSWRTILNLIPFFVGST